MTEMSLSPLTLSTLNLSIKDEEEDRISSLPDELICHILSFLTSLDSVRTCILSKRFYPLWRSVSTIDCHYYSFEPQAGFTYSKFNNFLFSLFLFRRITQPIKQFSLTLFSDHEIHLDHFNTWLQFVSQRGGVESLCLGVTYVDHINQDQRRCYWYDLPLRTLACRTLVVVDLSGFVLNSGDVASVELPLLRVLRLCSVKFAAAECLPRLLSGCPILEDFAAINVEIGFESDETNNSSLDGFKSLSKLIRAKVGCIYGFNLPLEVFHNVKDLDLIVDRVPPDYNSIDAFCNLTKLKLTFDRAYMWKWLIGLLNHCPKLRILELDILSYSLPGEHDDDDDCDDWLYTESIPECVSLRLRECTIHCYEDVEGGSRFARYIMQNASVLHKMRICVGWSEVLRFEIEKELYVCQKRSAACQLSMMIID